MESIRSPQRSSQYHFCVRITPKVLSRNIFQTRGTQKIYKLQIYKANKKETYNVQKRNFHQQALQGFYKSQNCYFSLNNYSNFRPIQMQVKFSQINEKHLEQKTIFIYKFSTYNLVKNFLQNGVRRTTHIVAKDFETEFYIDFYIQNNKHRLQDKVRSDANKQNLKKKHFNQHNQIIEKQSEKNSGRSNSPSKFSLRTQSFSNLNRIGSAGFVGLDTRSSTPMINQNLNKSLMLDDSISNPRSQRHSSTTRYKSRLSEEIPQNTKNLFVKKHAKSRLSYGDFIVEQFTEKSQSRKFAGSNRLSVQNRNEKNYKQKNKIIEKKKQDEKDKTSQKERESQTSKSYARSKFTSISTANESQKSNRSLKKSIEQDKDQSLNFSFLFNTNDLSVEVLFRNKVKIILLIFMIFGFYYLISDSSYQGDQFQFKDKMNKVNKRNKHQLANQGKVKYSFETETLASDHLKKNKKKEQTVEKRLKKKKISQIKKIITF